MDVVEITYRSIEYDFEQFKQEAKRRLQECYDAPKWESQDNLLAKVEAIRLRAYQEILALGFEDEEITVDISLSPEEMTIFQLAKELKWHVSKNGWYEPACETNGGSITIYFEPEEVL